MRPVCRAGTPGNGGSMRPHRTFSRWMVVAMTIAALGAATGIATGAPKLCTKNGGENGMTCKTSRLQVEILNGVIVSAKDLRTQEVHANGALNDVNIPRGMGSFYPSPAGPPSATAASSIHGPWNTYPLYAENLYFHHPAPSPTSTLSVDSTTTTCTAIWTGLTNGTSGFPITETLRVDLSIGPSGELIYRTTVNSPRQGVYGALLPIANLTSNHRIFVPSFGGVMYDTASFPTPQIRTLDTAP